MARITDDSIKPNEDNNDDNIISSYRGNIIASLIKQRIPEQFKLQLKQYIIHNIIQNDKNDSRNAIGDNDSTKSPFGGISSINKEHSLSDRAHVSIISNYLRSNNYVYSNAVFLKEANMKDTINTNDVLYILNINHSDLVPSYKKTVSKYKETNCSNTAENKSSDIPNNSNTNLTLLELLTSALSAYCRQNYSNQNLPSHSWPTMLEPPPYAPFPSYPPLPSHSLPIIQYGSTEGLSIDENTNRFNKNGDACMKQDTYEGTLSTVNLRGVPYRYSRFDDDVDSWCDETYNQQTSMNDLNDDNYDEVSNDCDGTEGGANNDSIENRLLMIERKCENKYKDIKDNEMYIFKKIETNKIKMNEYNKVMKNIESYRLHLEYLYNNKLNALNNSELQTIIKLKEKDEEIDKKAEKIKAEINEKMDAIRAVKAKNETEMKEKVGEVNEKNNMLAIREQEVINRERNITKTEKDNENKLSSLLIKHEIEHNEKIRVHKQRLEEDLKEEREIIVLAQKRVDEGLSKITKYSCLLKMKENVYHNKTENEASIRQSNLIINDKLECLENEYNKLSKCNALLIEENNRLATGENIKTAKIAELENERSAQAKVNKDVTKEFNIYKKRIASTSALDNKTTQRLQSCVDLYKSKIQMLLSELANTKEKMKIYQTNKDKMKKRIRKMKKILIDRASYEWGKKLNTEKQCTKQEKQKNEVLQKEIIKYKNQNAQLISTTRLLENERTEWLNTYKTEMDKQMRKNNYMKDIADKLKMDICMDENKDDKANDSYIRNMLFESTNDEGVPNDYRDLKGIGDLVKQNEQAGKLAYQEDSNSAQNMTTGIATDIKICFEKEKYDNDASEPLIHANGIANSTANKLGDIERIRHNKIHSNSTTKADNTNSGSTNDTTAHHNISQISGAEENTQCSLTVAADTKRKTNKNNNVKRNDLNTCSSNGSHLSQRTMAKAPTANATTSTNIADSAAQLAISSSSSTGSGRSSNRIPLTGSSRQSCDMLKSIADSSSTANNCMIQTITNDSSSSSSRINNRNSSEDNANTSKNDRGYHSHSDCNSSSMSNSGTYSNSHLADNTSDKAEASNNTEYIKRDIINTNNKIIMDMDNNRIENIKTSDKDIAISGHPSNNTSVDTQSILNTRQGVEIDHANDGSEDHSKADDIAEKDESLDYEHDHDNDESDGNDETDGSNNSDVSDYSCNDDDKDSGEDESVVSFSIGEDSGSDIDGARYH